MARIYSNENFDRSVVEKLRELGHDVLTSYDAGNANLGITDEALLTFAIAEKRIVLTFNRLDFIRLHEKTPFHYGIIVCTRNPDIERLATKIHEALPETDESMESMLVRIYRDP